MTTHVDAVRDALASHTDDYRVERELHRVRPHATYEVRFRGRRAVCKLATHPAGDPATEARVVEYVRAATDLPVPRVLAVGDDYFVAAWLDGLPVDTTPAESKLRTMGRGLAHLHVGTAEFDRTSHLAAGANGLTLSEPAPWSETLCALLRDRRVFLADHGRASVADAVLAFVRNHREMFDTVDDAVLVHGNWLAEHVGTDGGEVRAVVDFEHALVGSPEWDYLRTVVPTFGGEPANENGVAESVFREAYESVRPLPAGFDRRRAAYRAVLGVSYLKALYLQRLPLDDPADVEARADRFTERTREALATAQEVVE